MNSSLTLRRHNLFELVFPQMDLTVKIFLVLGCSWLMALVSRLSFPLPFTPVPVTGQTFAVLLLASVLGWRLALTAQLLYLAQGLAGLPVFSPGITWGPARLFGPTGGYLAGFLLATLVVGWLSDRGWGRRFNLSILMMVLGECSMYLIAVPWLKWMLHVDWSRACGLGLFPFIVGDAYKIVLAALVLPVAWRHLRKSNDPAV